MYGSIFMQGFSMKSSPEYLPNHSHKSSTFHPYKVKLVQELNEDDYNRRLQFCEIMSTNLTNNVNFFFFFFFFLSNMVNHISRLLPVHCQHVLPGG